MNDSISDLQSKRCTLFDYYNNVRRSVYTYGARILTFTQKVVAITLLINHSVNVQYLRTETKIKMNKFER